MAEIICNDDNVFDFSEIGKGIVFKYEDDFYIKTDVVNLDSCAVRNCVNLKTGRHELIDPDAKISIFNKMTLERL